MTFFSFGAPRFPSGGEPRRRARLGIGALLALALLGSLGKDQAGSSARAVARPRGAARPAGSMAQALITAQNLPATGGSWSLLGPSPLVTNDPAYAAANNAYSRASGRVLSLAYSAPTATLYLGAADGGVWKTSDSGSHWTPLSDGMPSMTIGALLIDSSDATGRTILAGTGEISESGDALYGVGVYRSTDGGAHWSLTGGDLFANQSISALGIDPTTTGCADMTRACRVYAGVTSAGTTGNLGVAMSTDGGLTWTEPTGTPLSGNDVTDLRVDPSGGIYAAVGRSGPANGVYYSSDHGASWTRLGTGLPSDGAACTAPAPGSRADCGGVYKLDLSDTPLLPGGAQPTVFVAVAGLNGPLQGLYRESVTPGGNSWVPITGNLVDTGYQSNYDLVLRVDPNDPTGNSLYVGTVDLFHTGNARSVSPTWQNVTNVFGPSPAPVHPDGHALAFVGNTLYLGHDGGVSSLLAGGGWQDANGNLAITQFYGGDVSPTDGSLVFGGTQDNGAALLTDRTAPPPGWTQAVNDDGDAVLIDPTNNSVLYADTFTGDPEKVLRSTDGGKTFVNTSLPVDAPANTIPLAMDPQNSSRLYAGERHVWRTSSGGVGGTAAWTDIGPLTSGITAVRVAPNDPNTLYVGDDRGHTWRTSNATDPTPAWTSLDAPSCSVSGVVAPNCGDTNWPNTVTSIAVDPNHSQIVTVNLGNYRLGMGNHALQSRNGGATWTDISASLPNVPFQSAAYNTAGTRLYLGADLGVYVSSDSGATWSVAGSGLPNAQVTTLVVRGETVTAFTHGRGVWRMVPQVPTAARVSRVRVHRLAGAVQLSWRATPSRASIGFLIYAGTVRVTPRPVPVNHSGRYSVMLPFSGHGPFRVMVVLRNGRTVSA